MVSDLCRLTLVYPPASESPLTELLMSFDPPLPGFTTWRGDGHGHGFDGATQAERVSGKVGRALLTSVMPRPTADRVLERIRAETPIPHLAFWIEPVIAAGRLT